MTESIYRVALRYHIELDDVRYVKAHSVEDARGYVESIFALKKKPDGRYERDDFAVRCRDALVTVDVSQVPADLPTIPVDHKERAQKAIDDDLADVRARFSHGMPKRHSATGVTTSKAD